MFWSWLYFDLKLQAIPEKNFICLNVLGFPESSLGGVTKSVTILRKREGWKLVLACEAYLINVSGLSGAPARNRT